jgi:hypothetical protein
VYYRVGHLAANTHNVRTRIHWLDQLWRLEGLVRDDETREQFPQLPEYLAAERRQAWRTVLRLGYPPHARRVPLRPYADYLRYRVTAAVGHPPPLYEAIPPVQAPSAQLRTS